MPHAQDTSFVPATPTSSETLAAFFALADAWKLSVDHQITLLGSPARSTFYKWKKEGGLLSEDTADRISHLCAIYKALQILLPNPAASDTWLLRSNRYFSGQTALGVMLGGKMTDILDVRAYLDAERGG